LATCLKKIVLSGKIIKDDLSRVKKSASKSTYKLGIGFEICEDTGEKSAPKFIPSSSYHKEEETLKSTKTHYPFNPKPSFNPKREVKRKSLKPREEVFICMFCGRADHLDEFCFRCKRLERRRFEYARNSYRDEFLIFRIVLTLVLHLTLLHAHFLSSLMDLTIAHMGLVHEITALSLDVLVMAHILIVVIISRVGLIFLQEGFTPILSRDTWMVHVFSIVVLISLVQMVKCKRL
jgi:hypothetical protein